MVHMTCLCVTLVLSLHRHFSISNVQGSYHFQIAIHKTLTQAMINGPGITLAQWLRLSRDIAYHEIRVSDVK
jgi:hypothetical protein